MLALTYLDLEAYMTAHELDREETVVDLGMKFVSWRGFTAAGPVQFDLALGPASSRLTVTLYDEDIEVERFTASTYAPDVHWAAEQLEAAHKAAGLNLAEITLALEDGARRNSGLAPRESVSYGR